MKKLIKAFDDLDFIIKLILCIPGVDVVWSVYRICRSLDKGSILGVILGILTIAPGIAFMWLVDIICVLVNKKVWWID